MRRPPHCRRRYGRDDADDLGAPFDLTVEPFDPVRGVELGRDTERRGANPAEFPVEVPVNYELVINKALRLTLSASLLVRAEEGIE